MFYGYPPCAFDAALQKKLSAYVKTLPKAPDGTRAYVQRGQGVKIRKLTGYPQEQINQITAQADFLYAQCETEWQEKQAATVPYGTNKLPIKFQIWGPGLAQSFTKKQQAFLTAARYAVKNGVTTTAQDINPRRGSPEVWEFYYNGTVKVVKYAEKA